MTCYLYEFSVTGRTDFPVDMLRRDECYPANVEDARNIWGTVAGSFAADGPVTIKLHHCDSRGHWSPTEGRWASFGWSVDPGSIMRSKRS